MLYMQVEINLCQEYEMKDIYFFCFMFCMQEEVHLCQEYVLKDIYFFFFKLCMQVEIHLCRNMMTMKKMIMMLNILKFSKMMGMVLWKGALKKYDMMKLYKTKGDYDFLTSIIS